MQGSGSCTNQLPFQTFSSRFSISFQLLYQFLTSSFSCLYENGQLLAFGFQLPASSFLFWLLPNCENQNNKKLKNLGIQREAKNYWAFISSLKTYSAIEAEAGSQKFYHFGTNTGSWKLKVKVGSQKWKLILSAFADLVQWSKYICNYY